jgi:hypothetical protein
MKPLNSETFERLNVFCKKLPRILSPNLGCPVILSPEDLETIGIDIVIAEKEEGPEASLSLVACPSFSGEGSEFSMELAKKGELTEDTLPPNFEGVGETRWLISNTLRSRIFGGKARFFLYRAKPIFPLRDGMLKAVNRQHRLTLYDLLLKNGEQWVGTVFHSLCLRPPEERLRFIHLTDLHTALRNDLYEDNLRDTVSYSSPGEAARKRFNNFNENLRCFIRYANDLADKGELDFVFMLGDLIDFLRQGFHDREDFGGNNYRFFRGLVLGGGNEKNRSTSNPGLKVPIFTSTGNHDWRLFSYDASLRNTVFGLDKETAKQLDLFWADEQEEITNKAEAVYKKLLREGSPISNHTRLGWWINVALRRLEKWQVQLLTPLGASVVAGFLAKIPAVGAFLAEFLGPYYAILTSLIALGVVPIATASLSGLIKWFVRKKIMDLIAVEAGWQALEDYLLSINPYFNYAFRLGRNYFLILDTGHDCLRAQYLWDDGDKKLGPLSIRDNLIGGSPDSMAFYDINEYYPYSQIGWMDRLMERITREGQEGTRPVRIVIGLHAPAANLSQKERRKASQLPGNLPEGVLLPKGQFNIRYGTVNHYLSQFLHLCLGRVERDPGSPRYRPVDVVLAGHAHWKLEMRLAWDQRMNRPALYYGDFTKDGSQFSQTFERLRPFLLQTPASGPRENFSPEPPYFRRLEIDGQGNVCAAEVLALKPNGTIYVPDLSS